MPTKEPVAKRMEESSDSSDSEADSEDEVIIYSTIYLRLRHHHS
jgi:hypothetical protein